LDNEIGIFLEEEKIALDPENLSWLIHAAENYFLDHSQFDAKAAGISVYKPNSSLKNIPFGKSLSVIKLQRVPATAPAIFSNHWYSCYLL